MPILSRRSVLTSIGAVGVMTTVAPGFALAPAETDGRFLFIFLRGALDALQAVPAYGEPGFKELRGILADGAPGEGTEYDARKLDGLFAMNIDLAYMHQMYTAGELAVLHATCHGYRDRSHFDAQDAFDRGTVDKALKSGWINRMVASLPGGMQANRENVAMGLGATLPLSLRGPESVGNWSPPISSKLSPETLARLRRVYAKDELLNRSLLTGISTQSQGSAMMEGNGSDEGNQFVVFAQAAARFLKPANGARIATIDYGGWDSHADQNARAKTMVDGKVTFSGRFPELYLALDRGVKAFREGIGDAWNDTVVVMVDGVRTDRAHQRHARNRPWHGRRRVRDGRGG